MLRARIAAHTLHAQRDSRELTQAARDARWEGYLSRVDPDRKLTDAERTRRAESARAADMSRLALKSSQARAARKVAS